MRPEHLALSPDGTGANVLAAEVYTRQILGTDILYELTANGHLLRAVTPTSQLYDSGDRVGIRFNWSDAFLFDPASENALT